MTNGFSKLFSNDLHRYCEPKNKKRPYRTYPAIPASIIKKPEKYIPNFKNLDPRQQEALINKKWPSDIQRQKEQKQISEGILKEK